MHWLSDISKEDFDVMSRICSYISLELANINKGMHLSIDTRAVKPRDHMEVYNYLMSIKKPKLMYNGNYTVYIDENMLATMFSENSIEYLFKG